MLINETVKTFRCTALDLYGYPIDGTTAIEAKSLKDAALQYAGLFWDARPYWHDVPEFEVQIATPDGTIQNVFLHPTVTVTFAVVARETSQKCKKCSGPADGVRHGCPYRMERNIDLETLCNCCPACTQECSDEC